MKKKCKAVLLPTEDKTNLIKNSSLDILFTKNHKDFSEYGVKFNAHISYQHLYILSDDKIEEGDWVIGSGNKGIPFRADAGIIIDGQDTHKKIIATTDFLITKTKSEFSSQVPIIPQISQQFIEEYCKNPVDEVFVEMELNAVDSKFNIHLQEHENISKLEPVLTDNNEIIISPVEEKMISLSKIEELINGVTLETIENAKRTQHTFNSKKFGESLWYWIKENL